MGSASLGSLFQCPGVGSNEIQEAERKDCLLGFFMIILMSNLLHDLGRELTLKQGKCGESFAMNSDHVTIPSFVIRREHILVRSMLV